MRRQYWRRLTGEAKGASKARRCLWLKHPWNLKDEEKRRLSPLCRTNRPIVRAYDLKHAFQRFWDYESSGWGAPYLKQWLWWASPAGSSRSAASRASSPNISMGSAAGPSCASPTTPSRA